MSRDKLEDLWDRIENDYAGRRDIDSPLRTVYKEPIKGPTPSGPSALLRVLLLIHSALPGAIELSPQLSQ